MVQRYNILGRYTNQYLCLCSRAWSVEVSHGKIRVRPEFRYINCQNELTCAIDDLDFAADYVVCVFVKTIDGKTIYMRGVSFSTSDVSVVTRPATNITACSATLNGYAPNGILSVKARGFRWRVKGTSEYNIVYASSDFAATVENLFPDTNYEYQAFIQTTDGNMLYGGTLNFTTLTLSISVNCTGVIYKSITLKGNINVKIVADIIIEYKKSSESTFNSVVVKSDEYGHFDVNLINLTPGTYYDYKATISHLFGNRQQYATTSVESCKTLDVLVQTLTPIIGNQTTSVLNGQVVLRGEANGVSDAGTVGFEMALNTIATAEVLTYLTTLEGTTFSVTRVDVKKGEYKYRAFYREDDYIVYGSWVTFEIDGSVIDEPKEAYAVYKDSTLTFYYDNLIRTRIGIIYRYDANEFRTSKDDGWAKHFHDAQVNTVVFDPSFGDFHELTTTRYWFGHKEKSILTEFRGMQYLNTEYVTDMSWMFWNCVSLSEIDLSHLDTHNVTTMIGMFFYCKKLKTLDLTYFNTEKVTDMMQMFSGCSGLVQVDLSSFNTQNVKAMSRMFTNCDNLKSLDLSNFNTSNVVTMNDMFQNCSRLVSLDVSSFNTEKVYNMAQMFHEDHCLKDLDLSSFNTKNVTTMHYMFCECYSLTHLEISTFVTTNVTDMGGMFRGCSGLTILDVSGFKTDNVTNMSSMFSSCRSLTNLDVSGFKTDNVTDMRSMFSGCSGLTSLDVSGFKTDNVTDMSAMFSGCRGLTSLDVSGFKTDNVTNMLSMFSGCSGLTSLDASSFKTDNVMDMSDMFAGCSGLASLNVSGFKTDKVMDMGGMFYNCSNLTSLNLSDFDTSKVTDMSSMFRGCTDLTSLDLRNLDTSKVTNMSFMFNDCSSLTSLNLRNLDTSELRNIENMFYGCSGLTNLNLSGFNTSNVTDMSSIFYYCCPIKVRSSIDSIKIGGQT